MSINIGSAVIPVQEERKRKVTELTELTRDSKQSIFDFIFSDNNDEAAIRK